MDKLVKFAKSAKGGGSRVPTLNLFSYMGILTVTFHFVIIDMTLSEYTSTTDLEEFSFSVEYYLLNPKNPVQDITCTIVIVPRYSNDHLDVFIG